MREYIVKLRISAECQDDARELIEDYSGRETDIEIFRISRIN